MTISDVRPQTIVYPESDDEPVGETDDHRELRFELIFVLKNLLRETTAYVAGNLFVYYEEGEPASEVAPDVFVIFGVPQQNRRTYKTWEHEGKTPDMVIELTSSKTRYVDLGEKRVRYAELGVQEYYLFDPHGDYLNPRLRGYQLVDGELIPMPGNRVISKLINVKLRVIDNTLRLCNIMNGVPFPTPEELEDARQQEADARQQAESEVARLQAELDALKSSPPKEPR